MIWNKDKQLKKAKQKNKPKAKKRVTTKVSRAKKSKTMLAKRATTKRKLPKKPRTAVTKKSTLNGMLGKVTSLATIKQNPIVRLGGNRAVANVEGRLALAFKQLHTEFNKREQQLEARMQEIQLHHDLLLEKKQNQRKWLIPLAFAVAVAGGYMLYVLTSMQYSMSSMTGSIGNMNNYMASMSSDTQVMSRNIQTMNRSMYNMSGNVQGMSRAMEPMADVASTASPFTKMFKSMMPF